MRSWHFYILKLNYKDKVYMILEIFGYIIVIPIVINPNCKKNL